MYGARAHLGLIVPSVNTCTEPQFRMMAPRGVEFFTTRLRLRDVSTAELRAMAEHTEDAAALLADLDPAFILFHCTSASMFGGAGYDARIAARIESATGRPAGTTAAAVVQALRSFGARRVALITPYAADTNAVEVTYLAEQGFEVVENVALDLAGSNDYPRLDPKDWRQVIGDADTSQADAIFVSCTNIRITGAIDHIEQDLGKPVVTSNQAGLWYSLRRIGLADGVSGFGSLLRNHLELPI